MSHHRGHSSNESITGYWGPPEEDSNSAREDQRKPETRKHAHTHKKQTEPNKTKSKRTTRHTKEPKNRNQTIKKKTNKNTKPKYKTDAECPLKNEAKKQTDKND